MTEQTYRKTKLTLTFILSSVIVVMNLSELSYIPVGEHVYLDLSMIPAAIILMSTGYRTSLAFGIGWGLLSMYTHPWTLLDYYPYIMIFLSQVVFSISIVLARKVAYQLKGRCNVHHAVFFAIVMHSMVFDFGVFSWLKLQMHETIPYSKIFFKIILTDMFFLMTSSFIAKQLHQVHVSNVVKRSEQ